MRQQALHAQHVLHTESKRATTVDVGAAAAGVAATPDADTTVTVGIGGAPIEPWKGCHVPDPVVKSWPEGPPTSWYGAGPA